MTLNYRVYHIDAQGVTKSHHNFKSTTDTLACEAAGVLMSESEWPGIEVWEGARMVHCKGANRIAAGPSEIPS